MPLGAMRRRSGLPGRYMVWVRWSGRKPHAREAIERLTRDLFENEAEEERVQIAVLGAVAGDPEQRLGIEQVDGAARLRRAFR